MKSYSEISNKYMKENKKRTVLTIMGITLATILIFAVGTFLLSFKDSMLTSERAKSDWEFMIQNISGDKAEKLAQNAEVKDSAIEEKSVEYSIEGSEKIASLYKGNADYLKKIETDEVIEGREPEKDGEVLIDQSTQGILKCSVDDDYTLVGQNGEKIKVTIVGVSKSGGYATNGPVGFETYLDKVDSSKNYNIAVNMKSEKGKQEAIKKAMKDCDIEISDEVKKSDNNQILYLTGNGGNDGMTKALAYMATFVVGIIMVCTIAVIYNSFNISVIERIKYFGILKAIGSTPKQIRRIIFKEGALMTLIALPIGCLVGFLGLKYGMKIFIGDTFLLILENFKVGFYPEVLLATAALVAITVLISVLMPARKAKRVSAVEAMRNNNEIKIGKIKKRRSGLIQKIFGLEGSLAYKNIKRTPFRFIVTVLALTISIVLFNVFYGFIDYAKQSINQMYVHISYDSILVKNDRTNFTDDELAQLKEDVKYSEIKQYYSQYSGIALPIDKINNDYTEKTGGRPLGNNEIDDTGYRYFPSVSFIAGGNDEIQLAERFLKDGKIDMDALKNGGVILIDSTMTTNKDDKKEIVRSTNYKVGDKIKIPKLSDYNEEKVTPDKLRTAISNNEFYEAPIVAIVEKDPTVGDYPNDGIEVMMHKDYIEKNFSIHNGNMLTYRFSDDTNRQDAIKYFDGLEGHQYGYQDMADAVKGIEQLYSQIEFFVYSFIIIVTIISIVNIFNTISTNLLLRKREFSTMKAIGMTEKQLRKSVLLEGTLYGIFAAVMGGILSVLLLLWLIKIGGGFADVEYHFAAIPFALSIVIAILVTYISTAIPLRNLKKISIVEGITGDE